MGSFFDAGKTARIIMDTEKEGRDAWLLARQSHVQGTDLAALINMGAFKGKQAAIDVYAEKTTPVRDEGPGENRFRFALGHQMEAVLAEWVEYTYGCEVERNTLMFESISHPVMGATPDGFARFPDGKVIGLEFKTADAFNRHKFHAGTCGADAILPFQYEMQVRHYMAVTGICEFWVVAFIVAGNDERNITVIKVLRDPDMEADIIRLEEDFWYGHVVPGIPPAAAAIGEESYRAMLKNQLNAVEEPVELDPALAGRAFSEYFSLLERKEDLKKELEETEGMMRALDIELARMAEGADRCECTFGESRYSRKVVTTSRTTYDSKKLRALWPDAAKDTEKVSMSCTAKYSVTGVE